MSYSKDDWRNDKIALQTIITNLDSLFESDAKRSPDVLESFLKSEIIEKTKNIVLRASKALMDKSKL